MSVNIQNNLGNLYNNLYCNDLLCDNCTFNSQKCLGTIITDSILIGDISQGELNLNGNMGMTGNISLNGNMGMTGELNLNGNMGMTGELNLNGNMGMTGNINIDGNIISYSLDSNLGNINELHCVTEYIDNNYITLNNTGLKIAGLSSGVQEPYLQIISQGSTGISSSLILAPFENGESFLEIGKSTLRGIPEPLSGGVLHITNIYGSNEVVKFDTDTKITDFENVKIDSNGLKIGTDAE